MTAYDTYGNVATGYRGTVALSSTDPHAVLPSSYKFTTGDAGQHTFGVTLDTAGTQSITVDRPVDVEPDSHRVKHHGRAGAATSFTIVGFPSMTRRARPVP